jgi:hypothetical protein
MTVVDESSWNDSIPSPDGEKQLCLEEEDGLVWFESDGRVVLLQKNINRIRHIGVIDWIPWATWDAQGRPPTVEIPNAASRKRCRDELARMGREAYYAIDE